MINLKKFILLLIISITIRFFIFKKNNIYKILEKTETECATINEWFIYGNHLNIKGNIEINDFDEIKIVFKGIKNEIEYNINYNNGKFNTSENINEGIYLDNIPQNDYILLLKTTKNKETKYYNLNNNTNYNEITYITTTKDNINNSINIKYSEYKNKKYMIANINKTTVSNNYYDIIIDPGHGGEDSGAIFANNKESELNLKVAQKLKENLEKIGLKVGLTRDKDIFIKPYGKNSRTSIAYESKAKYYISLHLNSFQSKMNYGGVEVYAPNQTNIDFAKNLATNIVDIAKTNYSKQEPNKIEKGVYIRTFTKEEINESIDEAKRDNHKPYPITTDTNYYFMIRETGGYITNAYIDGRNKKYEKNEYYNSNIGTESYLIEMGYINYWPDLNNIVDNYKAYAEGITKAIEEELKKQD